MRYLRCILKWSGLILAALIIVIAILFAYFNLPGPDPREDVRLGMTFSHRYASGLGLDWKEVYLALLDDVGVRKLRLPVYWDLVEKEPKQYDWSEIDWQLAEAKKRDAEVVLSIGQKVPRWPECHIPGWVGDDVDTRHGAVLRFMMKAVERYKDHPEVVVWQVENEPFLPFGICPPFDVDFFDQEVALVKHLDPSRPVLVTDSGELSLWVGPAARGDMFGTTLYRDIYSKNVGGYFTYPIGPNFFRAKEQLVRLLTDQEDFSVIELQGEPWASGWIAEIPLEEQFWTMDEHQLVENVDYARQVGFRDIYLWGGEWWYWMKVKKDYPAVWETGKELFQKYGE